MQEQSTSVALEGSEDPRSSRWGHRYRYAIPCVGVPFLPSQGPDLGTAHPLGWEFSLLWAQMINSWAGSLAFSGLQC